MCGRRGGQTQKDPGSAWRYQGPSGNLRLGLGLGLVLVPTVTSETDQTKTQQTQSCWLRYRSGEDYVNRIREMVRSRNYRRGGRELARQVGDDVERSGRSEEILAVWNRQRRSHCQRKRTDVGLKVGGSTT